MSTMFNTYFLKSHHRSSKFHWWIEARILKTRLLLIQNREHTYESRLELTKSSLILVILVLRRELVALLHLRTQIDVIWSVGTHRSGGEKVGVDVIGGVRIRAGGGRAGPSGCRERGWRGAEEGVMLELVVLEDLSEGQHLRIWGWGESGGGAVGSSEGTQWCGDRSSRSDVFSEKCEEAEGASRRYIRTTFTESDYGKWAGCRQLERTKGSRRRLRQPHACAAGWPALRGTRRDLAQ
jgi:hypothetical protein